MRRMQLFLYVILASLPAAAQKERADQLVREGNELYKKADYPAATEKYRQATATDPSSLLAPYDLANALYRQEQKVDAAKILNQLLARPLSQEMGARAWYNKGVILSDQRNLEESIEAYKNALRQDPGDREARENLQKALLELKRKQPPPPKQNENKKQQQQQQKQKQSQLDNNQTKQRLQLLQQKEKQVQERIQSEKNKGAGGTTNKDW